MYEITFGELVHLTVDSVIRFAQNDKDLVCRREGGGGWWPGHQPLPPSKTQMAVILSETKCSEESHANFKNYPFSSDYLSKTH